MSDPRKYRTREEEEQFESEDPHRASSARTSSTNAACARTNFDEDQAEVRKEVREAVKWADGVSRAGPLEELYKDVYIERVGARTRGTSQPDDLPMTLKRPLR
jgi:TPP-dependent pyruvate/acetoin dehydrogenase alpha subunit